MRGCRTRAFPRLDDLLEADFRDFGGAKGFERTAAKADQAGRSRAGTVRCLRNHMELLVERKRPRGSNHTFWPAPLAFQLGQYKTVYAAVQRKCSSVHRSLPR